MGNTEKNSEAANQNQQGPQLQSGMYSDVMRFLNDLLLSKNLITREQLMKVQQKQKDNTIDVMFLKRKK